MTRERISKVPDFAERGLGEKSTINAQSLTPSLKRLGKDLMKNAKAIASRFLRISRNEYTKKPLQLTGEVFYYLKRIFVNRSDRDQKETLRLTPPWMVSSWKASMASRANRPAT